MGKIFVSRKNRYSGDLPAFYVGRPSPLGNPFQADRHGLAECLSLFRVHLSEKSRTDPAVISHLRIIREALSRSDVVLLCWCRCDFNPKKSDHDCHAGLIRDFLEAEAGRVGTLCT